MAAMIQFHLFFPVPMLKKLRSRARKEGISVSELVRNLVRAAL